MCFGEFDFAECVAAQLLAVERGDLASQKGDFVFVLARLARYVDRRRRRRFWFWIVDFFVFEHLFFVDEPVGNGAWIELCRRAQLCRRIFDDASK